MAQAIPIDTQAQNNPTPTPKPGIDSIPQGDTALDSGKLAELDAWSKQPGQYPVLASQNPQFFAQLGVYNTFKDQFGRAPSAQELAQFQGLGAGMVQGISTYRQQVGAPTPQDIYNQQQQKYLQDAPKYSDQVNSVFQSQLGRDATADEKNHFGALIASGQDPYQIQQALQQTQEYQNTANTKFQNQLQGQLQQSNSTYFNQYIAPALQAQAAQSGRSLDSSGVNAQLANAALQQNQGLQQFLAGTTAQNYQNSTANATNQYNNLMGQQYGLQNANVSSGLANQAANTQYGQNLSMYQMQQQAYNNYLNQYGKRQNNALGGALQGGLSGATTGFMLGGPWGALAGGVAGAGLGGYAGSRGSTSPVQM